ncbi:MAG: IS630 family transposase [Magnetococcales bacterium]|nr:IS630 family transposase [Magnetococcales bacterium]
MDTTDGRKLSHKTLEEIRIRAVRQVEAGESPEVVIKTLGFHRSCIYEWIAKYREGGIDALRSRLAPGKTPKLNGKHLKWLYTTIVSTNPLQLCFPFALWTCGMVRELIRRDLGVSLSECQVSRVLHKLGLSPQKPVRKAWQRNDSLVDRWRQEEFPAIQEQAKLEGASILFADESAVRSDFHSGTTWAPIGQTPVVKTTGTRFKVNLISAIDGRGSMRFMAFEENFTADVFINFLKRLMHNADKPIFLILDGHSVHNSSKVRKYVKSTEGKLELFFLPPYSPNLNPAEHVWNYLKNHKMGRTPIAGPNQFLATVQFFMRSLQRFPAKIAGFFRHPETRYAVPANVG